MNTKLNSVLVKFDDHTLNYVTSVSAKSTEKDCRQYFVGKFFNMGAYPIEHMVKCIDIEFTNHNKPINQ